MDQNHTWKKPSTCQRLYWFNPTLEVKLHKLWASTWGSLKIHRMVVPKNDKHLVVTWVLKFLAPSSIGSSPVYKWRLVRFYTSTSTEFQFGEFYTHCCCWIRLHYKVDTPVIRLQIILSTKNPSQPGFVWKCWIRGNHRIWGGTLTSNKPTSRGKPNVIHYPQTRHFQECIDCMNHRQMVGFIK